MEFGDYTDNDRSDRNEHTYCSNTQILTRMKLLALLNIALAWITTVLFAWIIYPYKWIKRMIFRAKKEHAIMDADRLCKDLNKAVYVVQDSETFYVGTRAQLRGTNKRAKRCLPEYLRYDYRNAIVYEAMPWNR